MNRVPLMASMPSLQRGLPWPLPAVLAWAMAWAVYLLVEPNLMAVVAALVPPGWVSWKTNGLTRRVCVLAGFPVSLMLVDASLWPSWLWLLPAGVLLSLYPVRAWHDAPVFPTRASALDGLAQRLALPPECRLVDVGCGAGHGLIALGRQWPSARLTGVERSWPLVILSRWRCPHGAVHRADMWRHHWGHYDLVYVFQRPETMQRAWAKAMAEMKPGSYVVSLEFPVIGQQADDHFQHPGERPVWVYQIPKLPESQIQPPYKTADKPLDVAAPHAVC
jgi:hypothetical protein